MQKSRYKILLCATTTEMFNSVLKNQPRFLSKAFDVSLIAGSPNDIDILRSREQLVVHEIPMARKIKIWRDLQALVRLFMLLRKVKPDLIHSYSPKAGLLCMIAAKLAGVRVRIHTFTGLLFPTAKFPLQHILIFMDRLTCICATHIIPEGEGVKNDLGSFGITSKDLRVIGSGNIAGIDLNYFNPNCQISIRSASELRVKNNIPEDAFVYCFIGRLNKDKGILELLSAFRSLPKSCHLIVVGALDLSAPIEERLRDEIGSNSRIHSLGYLDDVRPPLLASNVLVLPSYREGFPNVVLQANAMGLPAIVTNVSGSNEIVKADVNGWIVPPRSSASLQDAMMDAMNKSKVTLADMGVAARSNIVQHFAQDEYWTKLQKYYLTSLESERAQ